MTARAPVVGVVRANLVAARAMSFRRCWNHGAICRKDRLKDRLRDVPNNRHTDAVPTNMIGVVVALGQTI